MEEHVVKFLGAWINSYIPSTKSDNISRVIHWKSYENTGRSTNSMYIINFKLMKH